MKRIWTSIAAALGSFLLFAGIASAHVVVYPQQTSQGAFEKFTVRVPSENKNSNTVKVEVRFNPADVAISRVEPKPGWSYAIAKDNSGAITGITWTAQGEGLTPAEFTEFNLQGKVGDQATAITWKAYQTYKDNSVVGWVGASDSDTPAPVTKVSVKPAGAADSGGHDAGHTAAGAGEAAGGSRTTLALAVAGVVLGALSLIVSLIRRRA